MLSGSGGGGASHVELMRLKKTNQQLHEENNLLKLKIDILLDMVCDRQYILDCRSLQVLPKIDIMMDAFPGPRIVSKEHTSPFYVRKCLSVSDKEKKFDETLRQVIMDTC